jgi:hypothetical protein
VIVAVIAVRVVQVAADQVIDMVAVRHRLVAAARAVAVGAVMMAAAVLRRAVRWIGGVDLQAVLFNLAGAGVAQVAVMEIVHVVAMPQADVSATRAVLVRVFSVHDALLLEGLDSGFMPPLVEIGAPPGAR